MRSLLYQHPSAVSALLSTTISVGLYFVHEYFFHFYPQYLRELLIFNILGSISIALFIGKLFYKLNNRVYTDSLTALWNRRYFNIRLYEELQRAKKADASFGVAFIDVDNFKEVNDHYGHVAGDQLLINIANTLKQSTRNIDIVSRWGGDEYAIIFPNVNPESLHLLAEHIRNSVLRSDICYNCSISVGVSLIDGDMEVDKILNLVDIKLYEDKKRKEVRIKGCLVLEAGNVNQFV
ncbi:MAG: diguanylate cyclase [Firmicutes bacterium]|nr:diguanylate cyclase [Bacillota bacterium]